MVERNRFGLRVFYADSMAQAEAERAISLIVMSNIQSDNDSMDAYMAQAKAAISRAELYELQGVMDAKAGF